MSKLIFTEEECTIVQKFGHLLMKLGLIRAVGNTVRYEYEILKERRPTLLQKEDEDGW